MASLFAFIAFALQIYSLILLARVIMTWIPNLDYSNPIVKLLLDLTEPVLKPIRQALPQTSGIDFSPMVAFLAIYLLTALLRF